MESVLYMWCGYLVSWKKYYFILEDRFINYCPQKGRQIEGKISLDLVNVHVPVDNPVCFNIHTGIDVIYLKALSVEDKVMWVKKLKSITKHRQQIDLRKDVSYKGRKELIISRFEEYIKQLWISHAKLQGAIQNFSQKNLKNYSISNNRNLLDQVRRSAASFKFKATQISKYLEDIAKYIKQQLNKPNYHFQRQLNDSINQLEDLDADDTQFLSFIQQQQNQQHAKISSRKKNSKPSKRHHQIFQNEQTNKITKKKLFTFNSERQIEFNPGDHTPIKQIYQTDNSIKKLLLTKNQVFIKISQDISSKRERDCLPAKFTLESKFPVLSTLTGALGSNLTKVAFPVTINQPLSMLQKGCQQLYYSQLLKQADRARDPIDRMSYVCAFVVSMLSMNQGRLKKPFNPLLGETFLFDDKERDFFYFSQQVSHHPPISAMYCRSQNFEYLGNSSSDLSFTGKSLKLTSSNRCYIQLNSQGDKYWFTKPTVSINNILFGNVYIQIHGEIQITCQMFKTKTKLNFNEKSWTKQQASIEGKVMKNDQEQLSISGFWNKFITFKDSKGFQKILWTKSHSPIPDQYNFNRYTLQLNHLYHGLIKQLPPTDSRFRPDQKILQYRDVDLAAKQKVRLEEKQRKKKKENDLLQKQHKIVWFRHVKHQNQEIYQFLNQKYETERFKDDKWSESLDIFN